MAPSTGVPQAPTQRRLTIKEKNAAKRAARFAAAEAAKPEQSRLRNRTDLEGVVRKRFVQSTIDAFNSIIDWFDEFGTTALGEPEGAMRKYFQPGAAFPSLKLIRQWLLYLAESRQGRITEKVALITLEGYLSIFQRAYHYYSGQIFEKEVKNQQAYWLRYVLAPEQGLNLKAKLKPIAYPKDVTLLIRTLFQPRQLSSFNTMLQPLQFCLIMNILIDTCGRIGELAMGRRDSEVLRWKDIEFWAFEDKTETGTTSREYAAIVRVEHGKYKTQDPNDWKDVGLRVLSPRLAFEDPARLLLILAILEGHLKDINGFDNAWEQLEQLPGHPHGRQILIKESSMRVPVFHGYMGGPTKPLLSNKVGEWFKRLGRASGLSYDSTSYCLRRGAAYLVHRHGDEESRLTLMGHKSGTAAFRAYKSKAAVIDLQATRHGLDPVDVTKFGSISLGAVEGAPVSLSAEGYDTLAMDPRMIAASERYAEALDACLQCSGTLAQARKDATPEFYAWRDASVAKAQVNRELGAVLFHKEYDKYLREHSGTGYRNLAASNLAREISGGSKPIDALDDQHEGDGRQELSDPTPDYTTSDPAEVEAGQAGELDALTGELVAERQESARAIKSALGDLQQATTSNDQVDEDGNGIDEGEPVVDSSSPQVDIELRLHKIARAGTARKNGRKGALRTWCPRPTRADGLFELVTTGDLTSSEVSNMLLTVFRMRHPLDRFPESLIPSVGTYDCRCCGKNLWRLKSDYNHIKNCVMEAAAAAAVRVMTTTLDQMSRVPCTWFNTNRKALCGQTFPEDRAKMVRHHRNHVAKSHNICRYNKCNVEFESRVQMYSHLEDQHHVPTSQNSSHWHYWCLFCEDVQFHRFHSPDHEAHYQDHVAQALEYAREYGYNGINYDERPMVPRLCIFCLHRPEKSAIERLPEVQDLLNDHIGKHLARIEASESSHCPASAASGAEYPLCASTELMSRDALRVHLKRVHGIDATTEEGLEEVVERKKQDWAKKRERLKKAGRTKTEESTDDEEDEWESEGDDSRPRALAEIAPNLPAASRKKRSRRQSFDD